MRTISLVVIALLALAIHSPPALAQSTVAVTQFKEAKKLYDEGKYEDALQLFQLAWEHSHSPNARLYIARSFKELGKIKPAYDEFRGTLRDATERIAEDPKYEGTQSAAAAELVLLEPKIGHLIVSLDPGDAKDPKVTLNGEPFPSVSWGSVVTMLPGKMTIVASAPGKQDVVREVDLAGGKTEAVALYFPPDPKPGASQPAPVPVEESEMSTLQLVGLITGAVGVATLLAGAGTGVATASKFAAVETACGDGPCTDARFNDVIDSGKTLEVVTYILLGVGGAAAITGTVLWFVGDESAAEEPAASAFVTPLPGGAYVGVGGRF